jgi:hypothetical protein
MKNKQKIDIALTFFSISQGIAEKMNSFTIYYKDLDIILVNAPLFLSLLFKNVDSDIPKVDGVHEN